MSVLLGNVRMQLGKIDADMYAKKRDVIARHWLKTEVLDDAKEIRRLLLCIKKHLSDIEDVYGGKST